MNLIKDVPEGKHNICIRLSGGADSSIIYYALCEKFAKNDDVNIVVVTLNTDKKPFYIPTAKKIINLVGEMTGKYPIEHITETIIHDNEKYTTVQEDLASNAWNRYRFIHNYTGITKNPPEQDMKNFFIDNYKRFGLDLKEVLFHIDDRDKTRDEVLFISNAAAVFPFGKTDKKEVAKAYNYYNMMDRLYPHTRSCEDFTDKVEHCGHCFFCAERMWGFDRLV